MPGAGRLSIWPRFPALSAALWLTLACVAAHAEEAGDPAPLSAAAAEEGAARTVPDTNSPADDAADAAVEASMPPAEAAGVGPPAPEQPSGPVEYQCDQPGSDGQAMIDRVQRGVYLSVCGTARWFDGLFGTRRYDQDSDATYGRLGVYQLWDDRDGFDAKLRLRARLALPTLENRLQLVFGRVDDREIIEESQSQSGPQLPGRFSRVEDEAWLLGLGYSKQGGLENGFDFGAGVRLRFPVDPYVKGTYRHNLIFDDATMLRARQTIFWRDSRGFGETTEFDFDRLLGPRMLARWSNRATLAEDVERFEWSSAGTLAQSFSNRRAIAYTTYVNGIINTDVPIRDFGLDLRYRQRALRKWLFLELRASLGWPKEFPEEKREINPGVGVGFEMYFGPVPDSRMR